MEIWKDVKGYEGIYEVSNLGNIKSLRRLLPHFCGGNRVKSEIILKIKIGKLGYCSLSLSKNNKYKSYLVHRLVCIAFIPNPENKPQVNHIDGNKSNNNAFNLEWVSSKENYHHSVNIGIRKYTKRSAEIKEKMRESAKNRNPDQYKKSWETRRLKEKIKEYKEKIKIIRK